MWQEKQAAYDHAACDSACRTPTWEWTPPVDGETLWVGQAQVPSGDQVTWWVVSVL